MYGITPKCKRYFCQRSVYTLFGMGLFDREGVPIAVQFQELYLPIIKLFERGGRIQYDKGLLIIGGLTCSRFVSLESSLFEPEDISDSYLDEIDKDV